MLTDDVNALKQQLEELKIQVATFQGQINDIDRNPLGGIWLWPKIDKNELLLSSQLQQLLQIPGEGGIIPASAAFANVHPDDKEMVRKEVINRLNVPGSFTVDYRVISDKGVVNWLRTFIEVSAEESGSFSAKGSTTLIDKEKRATEQRDLYVKTLGQIMETGGIYLWEWNKIGSSPIKFLGFSKDIEIKPCKDVKDPWASYLHKDSVSSFKEAIKNIIKKPGIFSTEVLLGIGGDECKWYICQGASTIDSQGNLRANGTLVDIDQRKLLEEKTDKFSSQVQLVIKGASGGIFDYPNTKEEYVDYDQSFFDLLGFEKTEIQSTRKWGIDLIHPDDRNQLSVEAQKAMINGDQFSAEFRILFADNGYRYVRSTATINLNYGGEGAHRITGMILDIHDRKVTTLQLEQANKQLERFSYLIAHDLNAPLRHISAFVSILHEDFEGVFPEDAIHLLNRINQASENATSMIRELLDYARTGTAKLSLKPVNLSHLIEELKEVLSVDEDAQHVQWEITDLPTLIADEAQMRMLFQNLLSNGIKFTRGKADARITIEAFVDQANEVEITVRDNGAGFDPRHGAKIFEAFERAHTSEEFPGTGIGLANVARIISRHGGSITAKAEVDKGAEFKVKLPRVVIISE